MEWHSLLRIIRQLGEANVQFPRANVQFPRANVQFSRANVPFPRALAWENCTLARRNDISSSN